MAEYKIENENRRDAHASFSHAQIKRNSILRLLSHNAVLHYIPSCSIRLNRTFFNTSLLVIKIIIINPIAFIHQLNKIFLGKQCAAVSIQRAAAVVVTADMAVVVILEQNAGKINIFG